jgi:MFS family permease
MHTHWAHVGRGAAGLGAAMGIGRFAYTPILPLMTTQAALTPQAAGTLATANCAGYLAGALAGTASPRLARSTVAWRVSLVAVVVTLAAMPLLPNTIGWLLLRTIAGFASAVVFVIAVNSMLDHATTPAGVGLWRRRPRHCAVGRVDTDAARRRGLAGRL